MKQPAKRVTQVEIARVMGVDISTVNKILNNRPEPSFREQTRKRVFEVARKLGYGFERLKREHRRRHPRRVVDLPVEISIYLAGDILYDRGTALLRDVSLSGALLEMLVLPGMKLPACPHTVGIRMLKGPLKRMEIRGRPVRFSRRGDAHGLAIEFLATEEVQAGRLAAVRA